MLQYYFEYYEKEYMGKKPCSKQICWKLKGYSLDNFVFKFRTSFLHTLKLSKLHPVSSSEKLWLPNNDNEEDYSLQDIALL